VQQKKQVTVKKLATMATSEGVYKNVFKYHSFISISEWQQLRQQAGNIWQQKCCQ